MLRQQILRWLAVESTLAPRFRWRAIVRERMVLAAACHLMGGVFHSDHAAAENGPMLGFPFSSRAIFHAVMERAQLFRMPLNVSAQVAQSV